MKTPLTLSYRPIVKKLFWYVIAGSLLAEMVIIRIKYPEYKGGDVTSALIVILLASTVPFTILFRMLVIIRPRIFADYEVCDDRYYRKLGKKNDEIMFSQIESVRISKLSPRFLGGFTLRLKSGQKATFLSLLKGNEHLLERIVNINGSLLSRERVQTYKATCQLVEFSWQRIQEKLKNWKVLLAKYLVVPVLISFSMKSLFSLKFVELWIIVTLSFVIFSLLLNHLEERFNNKHLLNRNDEVMQRDLKYEKQLALVFHSIYFVLSLLVIVMALR